MTDTTRKKSFPELVYTGVPKCKTKPSNTSAWRSLLKVGSWNTKCFVSVKQNTSSEKKEKIRLKRKKKKERTPKQYTDTNSPTPRNEVHRPAATDRRAAQFAHSSSVWAAGNSWALSVHKKWVRSICLLQKDPEWSYTGPSACPAHVGSPRSENAFNLQGSSHDRSCSVTEPPSLSTAPWLHLSFLGKLSSTSPGCPVMRHRHRTRPHLYRFTNCTRRRPEHAARRETPARSAGRRAVQPRRERKKDNQLSWNLTTEYKKHCFKQQ